LGSHPVDSVPSFLSREAPEALRVGGHRAQMVFRATTHALTRMTQDERFQLTRTAVLAAPTHAPYNVYTQKKETWIRGSD